MKNILPNVFLVFTIIFSACKSNSNVDTGGFEKLFDGKTSNHFPEKAWEFKNGHILIQDHRSVVHYKNILIKKQ